MERKERNEEKLQKIIALLLAITLVLGVVPFSAFAYEHGEVVEEDETGIAAVEPMGGYAPGTVVEETVEEPAVQLNPPAEEQGAFLSENEKEGSSEPAAEDAKDAEFWKLLETPGAEIPWQRPWAIGTAGYGKQENPVSGSRYRGVNAAILWIVSIEKNYSDPRWCTFKQAAEKGWNVKKGEKGVHVEFWSYYDVTEKKKLSPAETARILEDEPDRRKDIKCISHVYTVFNAEQIEGIPALDIPPPPAPEYREHLLEGFAERYLETEKITLHTGVEAFYRPSDDSLTMPPKVDFIVTDSPIILNPLYLTEGTEGERRAYTDDVFRRFSRYNNFCVFVERGQNFEQEGRIHNAAQSKELDRQITGLLEQYGIYYGKYTYERIHYIVPNCITTLKRVSAQRARERAEENRVDSTAQQEPVTADTATLEDFAALYASPPPQPKHMSADEIFEESSKYAGAETPVQNYGGMCL